MARRRRKPAVPSLSYEEDLTGHRQRRRQRLRRPSKSHRPKRPRTVGTSGSRRTRGELSHPHAALELGLGETDGLMELDETSYLAPCTREVLLAPPAVDRRRQSSVIAGLLGAALPDLEMEWMPGERIDLSVLGSEPLVLYCYPALDQDASLPATPLHRANAAQSRAFADRWFEFASFNHRVVGVSSQGAASQLSLATGEALPHVMLSDERLDLAEELGLPTFEVDGSRHYERATLIVRSGFVEKVFYPIPDPATHAAEVAAWLRGERD
jgi:peroxiredoxin